MLIARFVRTKEIAKSYKEGARHVPIRDLGLFEQDWEAQLSLTNFADCLSFIDRRKDRFI
jgi:hypothetical protein